MYRITKNSDHSLKVHFILEILIGGIMLALDFIPPVLWIYFDFFIYLLWASLKSGRHLIRVLVDNGKMWF